jgi:hypothetical protein
MISRLILVQNVLRDLIQQKRICNKCGGVAKSAIFSQKCIIIMYIMYYVYVLCIHINRTMTESDKLKLNMYTLRFLFR